MTENTYEYCGEPGGYVPGLPAVITDTEARRTGLLELLKQAVERGNYRLREEPAAVTRKISKRGE